MSVQSVSVEVEISRLEELQLKGWKTLLFFGELAQVSTFIACAIWVITNCGMALAVLILVTYPVDRLRWRVTQGRWHDYPHRLRDFPLMAYAWLPHKKLIWVQPEP